MEAYYRGDWAAAIALYGEILTLQPDRPGAAAKLAAAQREHKLAGIYSEALSLLAGSQQAEAIRHFETIQELAPDYRQTGALLVRARQELGACLTAEERAAQEAATLPPPAARSAKPSTLPEEIKPRPKPKDLPH